VISRQRGAALLVLMVLLASAFAAFGMTALQRGALRDSRREQDQRLLASGAEALRNAAFARRCLNTVLPLGELLPCPDGAVAEGIAAASCPGIARGWLPWRTLGLPPLKDSSGTCLWYERQGTTARVIAAGAAMPGQNRAPAAGRMMCGGSLSAADYLDASDPALAITLDTAAMVARCP
jgi:hypothetical protein